jgi:hypothetical protein
MNLTPLNHLTPRSSLCAQATGIRGECLTADLQQGQLEWLRGQLEQSQLAESLLLAALLLFRRSIVRVHVLRPNHAHAHAAHT